MSWTGSPVCIASPRALFRARVRLRRDDCIRRAGGRRDAPGARAAARIGSKASPGDWPRAGRPDGGVPACKSFDRVVAENGALVFAPGTRETELLGDAPSEAFVQELRTARVAPLSVGQVIVATWKPNDSIVLQVIRDMGLELQVIFNKGAVMVLPSGVNKATGLRRALERLKLSPHNIVGVGDAENDHAFLAACECSVAVANALDSIKTRVDLSPPQITVRG